VTSGTAGSWCDPTNALVGYRGLSRHHHFQSLTTTPLESYTFWRTSATFRVRAALKLKGVGATEHQVNLEAGEQRSATFLALNPLGAIPTLVEAGRPPLTQSLAVLEFLDETHPTPPLLPADPHGRERVRSLAQMLAADSHRLVTPRPAVPSQPPLAQRQARPCRPQRSRRLRNQALQAQLRASTGHRKVLISTHMVASSMTLAWRASGGRAGPPLNRWRRVAVARPRADRCAGTVC